MRQTKTVLRDPVFMVDFSVFKPEDELRINLNECADSCWKWQHPGGAPAALLMLLMLLACTFACAESQPAEEPPLASPLGSFIPLQPRCHADKEAAAAQRLVGMLMAPLLGH